MTLHELQFSTSFLLGKTYSTIKAILECESASRYAMLEDLEVELAKDIERLYYPKNPHTQDTHS
jgi:hypothetical protein